MARPPRVTGQFYHVFNRGVERRNVFLGERDYRRFQHGLFVFNDRKAALNLGRDISGREATIKETGNLGADERECLVDIVAYALMPNHYHLLLRQRIDGGVALFMQKIGIGYTKYFNTRYERDGVLFQGKYQVKVVEDDRYLQHLVVYQHLNPLDLLHSDWKKRGVESVEAALSTLEKYRWSSCQAYTSGFRKPAQSFLLSRTVIRDLGLPLVDAHRQALQQWLQDAAPRLASLGDLTLEGHA